MLQVLAMVFIAIGVVCCEPNCPIYDKFDNNPSLIKYLNGPFFKIIATGANVADCQIQTFSIGPNNNIVEGYLKSQTWCLHMTNCSSDATHQECDLIPVTAVKPPTLPVPQRNSIKIVWKFDLGDNFCLIYTYCRIDEEGVYLLCRKKVNFPTSIFLEALERWVKSPPIKRVEQNNCSFTTRCPP